MQGYVRGMRCKAMCGACGARRCAGHVVPVYEVKEHQFDPTSGSSVTPGKPLYLSLPKESN